MGARSSKQAAMTTGRIALRTSLPGAYSGALAMALMTLTPHVDRQFFSGDSFVYRSDFRSFFETAPNRAALRVGSLSAGDRDVD